VGKGPHITSKVLLLAQDDLVRVELTFQLGCQLLDALLVRRQPAERFENPFSNNASRDRIELRVFDARSLLEASNFLNV
jgi:hypothetical protein